MDIYSYAMQMEQESERYYRDLAEKCATQGVKAILTMLADEEANHYRILQQLQAQAPVAVDSTLLPRAKEVFAAMRGQQVFACDLEQVELYRKAQEIEEKTRKFYEEKAAEEPGPAQKEALLKIAREEWKHWTLLENIIQLLSRPQQWLENAEWTHLEPY